MFTNLLRESCGNIIDTEMKCISLGHFLTDHLKAHSSRIHDVMFLLCFTALPNCQFILEYPFSLITRKLHSCEHRLLYLLYPEANTTLIALVFTWMSLVICKRKLLCDSLVLHIRCFVLAAGIFLSSFSDIFSHPPRCFFFLFVLYSSKTELHRNRSSLTFTLNTLYLSTLSALETLHTLQKLAEFILPLCKCYCLQVYPLSIIDSCASHYNSPMLKFN